MCVDVIDSFKLLNLSICDKMFKDLPIKFLCHSALTKRASPFWYSFMQWCYFKLLRFVILSQWPWINMFPILERVQTRGPPSNFTVIGLLVMKKFKWKINRHMMDLWLRWAYINWTQGIASKTRKKPKLNLINHLISWINIWYEIKISAYWGFNQTCSCKQDNNTIE